jgi:cytoskeletal protein CcmA (bactofilin family)
MAITSFGKDRDTDRDSHPQTSGGAAPGVGGLTAFIDQGSEFEGKLSFRDTVRIDGRFRGEITSENTFIVGESGEIEATIRSDTIAISGTVVGGVFAKKKAVLHKTASVDGDIETPSLVVEEGARLNGRLTMPSADAKKPAAGAPEAVSGGGDASRTGKPKA